MKGFPFETIAFFSMIAILVGVCLYGAYAYNTRPVTQNPVEAMRNFAQTAYPGREIVGVTCTNTGQDSIPCGATVRTPAFDTRITARCWVVSSTGCIEN